MSPRLSDPDSQGSYKFSRAGELTAEVLAEVRAMNRSIGQSIYNLTGGRMKPDIEDVDSTNQGSDWFDGLD